MKIKDKIKFQRVLGRLNYLVYFYKNLQQDTKRTMKDCEIIHYSAIQPILQFSKQ